MPVFTIIDFTSANKKQLVYLRFVTILGKRLMAILRNANFVTMYFSSQKRLFPNSSVHEIAFKVRIQHFHVPAVLPINSICTTQIFFFLWDSVIWHFGVTPH